MPFSPDYVRLVLSENFEDAKTLFLDPLMAIHYAHLVMLAERGIVTSEQATALRRALDGIDVETVRSTVFDGAHEDLYFHVDHLIAMGAGADVAGRLNTARSRNDIDMTMYRMRLRECLLGMLAATLDLRLVLHDLAHRHRTTVFPAHTHTQPAQPTTVAHYLVGVIEELERHATRLRAAYATTNRCPLGSCAITGTGFPIDRKRTSRLLGFSAPTGNTYGSIAAVDYLLESAAAASAVLVGVGRFVQDLLLWSTTEVGYLRLPDGFVQTSSIMPQKRNPVALEHARALASRGFAQMQCVPIVVHNTPFGDIVDTEDDLQPVVASAFRTAERAVTLLARTMAAAEFNVDRMRERASSTWVTTTELADTLVRDHGLPFRLAHAIVADVVRDADISSTDLAERLHEISTAYGREIRMTREEVERLLSPSHFIEVRKTPGGPASSVVGRAIGEMSMRLSKDSGELKEFRAALRSADEERRQAAAAL